MHGILSLVALRSCNASLVARPRLPRTVTATPAHTRLCLARPKMARPTEPPTGRLKVGYLSKKRCAGRGTPLLLARSSCLARWPLPIAQDSDVDAILGRELADGLGLLQQLQDNLSLEGGCVSLFHRAILLDFGSWAVQIPGSYASLVKALQRTAF